MGYPEYILIALYVWSLVRHLLWHGEPMHTKWHNWAMCFVFPALLAWGGFFSPVGVPQVIYTMFWVLGMGTLFLNRKKMNDNKYDFYGATFAIALMLGLYWWGGFFS
tara:strand:+ start:202 stop:522 length:321 start_codon:yes stop_codon:yes gene_type:complete